MSNKEKAQELIKKNGKEAATEHLISQIEILSNEIITMSAKLRDLQSVLMEVYKFKD